jgi:hypothetical protein
MTTSFPNLLILGFVAGALATIVFHQSVWFALNAAGIVPGGQPAWSLDPIPPFGVPSVVSKAFWGGLWGALLALVLARIEGPAYWLAWIVVGAVALTLVAIYVVPIVKGLPVGEFWPRAAIGAAVNGAWGLGTGIFLRLAGVQG